MRTTVGRLLINEVLPNEYASQTRVLDKKGTKELLHNIFVTHPDKYREIAHKLSELGREVSYRQGSSISLDALKAVEERDKIVNRIKDKVERIASDVLMTPEERRKSVEEAIGDDVLTLQGRLYDAMLAKGNPFAVQVMSGSRGNKSQLAAMTGAMLLTPEADGKPSSIPILHSFAEGLDPAEYWATTYGARQGLVDTKFQTQDAGYLGKQLAMAAHKLVVTEKDCNTSGGILVPSKDQDSVGATLAKDTGEYRAGTVLTPSKLKELSRTDKNIFIRSPITCQAKSGLCQKCVGVRERGGFPPIGDNVGVTAATALAEKLSQGMLSAKHSSTGGNAVSGFEYINSLSQIPKNFPGGATAATVDGRVSKVEEAPQGGYYVFIGTEQHYVGPGRDVAVEKGDEVEAGDMLSTGIPNPADIVRYKGIGEGRRYFSEQFKKAFEESNQYANRRNTELMARALINHVRITEPDGGVGSFQGDVAEFDNLAAEYEPRYGSISMTPSRAQDRYLERPVLHYSIGTRITKRIAKRLKDAGYNNVLVHAEQPSFVPEMHRALDSMSLSPDWLVQQGGFYTKRSLLKSVQQGASSSLEGTSHVPKMVAGIL